MSYEIVETDVFKKTLKAALKKHSKSVTDIEKKIETIGAKLPGDSCTLFSPHHMKKVRFELKAYNISKRKGMRLFYLVVEDRQVIIPVFIYKKGQIKTEQSVTADVKRYIKLITDELSSR